MRIHSATTAGPLASRCVLGVGSFVLDTTLQTQLRVLICDSDLHTCPVGSSAGGSSLLMTSTTDEAVKKYSLKVDLYGGRRYSSPLE